MSAVECDVVSGVRWNVVVKVLCSCVDVVVRSGTVASGSTGESGTVGGCPVTDSVIVLDCDLLLLGVDDAEPSASVNFG